MGKTTKSLKTKTKTNNDNTTNSEKVCKSCGEKGHSDKRSTLCKHNKKNQEIYNGKQAEKKLNKQEKVEKAIEDENLEEPIAEAENVITETQDEMQLMLDKMQAEMLAMQEEYKKKMEIATAKRNEIAEQQKAKLLEKWEKENAIEQEKYYSEYIATCEEINITHTDDTYKLYQKINKFKELPKPWEKCKPARKSGGGGGGGERTTGPRPTCNCQARKFFRFNGVSTRPDYCGKEKVAGTNFCVKHQKTRKEGVMNDGILPEWCKGEDGLVKEKYINCEKYGEENKKQFGL
tara:strand:+ start:159 stop:1031 length:873 start_codon:yes stop_codon:yes gene_type:complete